MTAIRKIFLTSTLLGMTLSQAAFSQSNWWPSKYGKDDQAGASNLIDEAKIKAAAALIKKGKIYSLAHDFEKEMPVFGSRVFALRGTGAPGLPGGEPLGDNKVVWNDDFLSTEIGQVGSQFDALGHFGVRTKDGDRYYNGVQGKEINHPFGLLKLGIEHVKPFFTRGILVNVEAYKGKALEKGYEITIEDLKGALKKQGFDAEKITSGDVVIIHTGWGRLWKKDNALFLSGEPGIGLKAAKWLASKNVAIVGGDTVSMEVVPNPDPKKFYDVHEELITRNGIYIMECLATERLADDGVTEFAFSFTPVPIKGATGSPANATAIL